MWDMDLRSRFPDLQLHVIATEIDPTMGLRANKACYPYSSVKDLPAPWRRQAFLEQNGRYRLKSEYRRAVEFLAQDIRERQPRGRFDLVLCRNLVFTYYDEELQRKLLRRISDVLLEQGALALGMHEHLPPGATGFSAWSDRFRVYRKSSHKVSAVASPAATQPGPD